MVHGVLPGTLTHATDMCFNKPQGPKSTASLCQGVALSQQRQIKRCPPASDQRQNYSRAMRRGGPPQLSDY